MLLIEIRRLQRCTTSRPILTELKKSLLNIERWIKSLLHFSYQKIISERIMMSKKRLQEEMQLLNTTPILVIGVVSYSLVI